MNDAPDATGAAVGILCALPEEQDLLIEDGQIVLYRTKIRLSFKHESGE